MAKHFIRNKNQEVMIEIITKWVGHDLEDDQCYTSIMDHRKTSSKSKTPAKENYFATLPIEMIQEIFSYLSYKDRRNIDLSCKRFPPLTQAIEYKMSHKHYKYISVFISGNKHQIEDSIIGVFLPKVHAGMYIPVQTP
uniref:F-box domain-containing protein n=1 Tax=Rhabditophanes sp. KR3021 TaxID=114890 RepID=A0AC35TRN1_9BILA